MIPLKKRLTDLEDLLELKYEKLSYFQEQLEITASAPSKFELMQRIKKEVLPSLHECELEYWGILRQFSSKCDIVDQDAQSAMTTIVQDLQTVKSQVMPQEVLQLLESILQKLDEPGTAAAAKAKFVVNVIPGILAYEFELDTENSLRRVFQPLRQLFGVAAKK